MTVSSERTIKRTINASVNALRDTVDAVMVFFVREFGELDETSGLELRVVLNELLVNAMAHGCKYDPSSRIVIEAHLTGQNDASIVVEDDGEGYDTSANIGALADPGACPTDDISDAGRGLAIVRSLCRRFSVNEKGNKVAVRMKLSRAPK